MNLLNCFGRLFSRFLGRPEENPFLVDNQTGGEFCPDCNEFVIQNILHQCDRKVVCPCLCHELPPGLVTHFMACCNTCA